jgi:hypothetical protein
VPAVLNVTVPLCPRLSVPVLNESFTERALCCTPSRFVQRTLSPALIVTLAGANAKFWMFTVLVAASGPATAADIPARRKSSAATATRRARIT